MMGILFHFQRRPLSFPLCPVLHKHTDHSTVKIFPAGAEPLVPGAAGKKPLSVAIDELYKGKVKILPGQEEEEELEALEAEKEALEAAEGETAEGTETAEAAQTEAE